LVIFFSKNILLSPIPSEIYSIWANQIVEMKHFYEFSISQIIKIYAMPSIALILNLILLPSSKRHKKLLTLNLIMGLPLYGLYKALKKIWEIRKYWMVF
jgi:hypothetical protein